MDKRVITQSSSHDSLGTLIFWHQKSWWNFNGITPNEGASNAL